MLRIALLCLFFILSGCAIKSPIAQSYEITFNQALWEDYHAKNPQTVKLELNVSPKIAHYKIAYKNNENQIAYFAKNVWIEPFSDLLKTFAQRAILYAGFTQDEGGKVITLNVLDCYFDAKTEKVVFNLFVKIEDSHFILKQEEEVAKGDFLQIIQAFERAINHVFIKIFQTLEQA